MSASLLARPHPLLASGHCARASKRPRPRVVAAAAEPDRTAPDAKEPAAAGGAGRADVLARLAGAQQYKQQQGSSARPATDASTNAAPVLVTPSAVSELPAAPQPASTSAPTSVQTLASTPTATSTQTLPSPSSPASNQTISSGPDQQIQTAPWLQGVFANNPDRPVIDQELRAEEFTQQKESIQRAQGADIISIDKNYKPDYKPKVSTWGVFPRPANISQTYGGGRTIRPGEALETEEEAAARARKTQQLLDNYKKQIGAYLEPEIQERCDALMREAEDLFKAGRLRAAFDKYDEILKLVPPRTKMGGLASLQRAIIMDSFGYNEQAQAQYKSLVIHPTPEVAKRAKRMLFGFDAAKFLKADTMDFSGKKQAWAKYFTQNSRVVYVQSEEEKARDAAASRQAALLAVAVMLGPVVVFGFLALSK